MKEIRYPELKELGKRLATLRKKKGMSMEKVAYEASISKGNLCDIEAGRRNPRYCTLRSIAHALGMQVSQLLEGL
jgi:XRE family transcriptional regulator, regulator of sulfur utilization